MSESFVLMYNSSWVIAVLSVLGLYKHPEVFFIQPLLYYRLECISPLCIKGSFLHYYFWGQGFLVLLVSELKSCFLSFVFLPLLNPRLRGVQVSHLVFAFSDYLYILVTLYLLFVLSRGRTIPGVFSGRLSVFQYLVSQITFIKDIAFRRVCWERAGTACCI